MKKFFCCDAPTNLRDNSKKKHKLGKRQILSGNGQHETNKKTKMSDHQLTQVLYHTTLHPKRIAKKNYKLCLREKKKKCFSVFVISQMFHLISLSCFFYHEVSRVLRQTRGSEECQYATIGCIPFCLVPPPPPNKTVILHYLLL